MKIRIINKAIEEEIANNFLLDEYRLFLKVQWLSIDTIAYYINYIYLFIKYSKLKELNDFNNKLKIKISYNKLFDTSFKESTLIKYRKTIIKYYTFLINEELVDSNYWKTIQSIKPQKSLPKSLDEKYIPTITKYIINNFKKDFYKYRALTIFNTFINTWVRRTELINIKKCNISPQYIKIESWKWNKDRLIYISKEYYKSIKDYLELIENNSQYLFSEPNWKQMSKTWVNKIFAKIKKWLQIDIYPHLLRHTYASLCVKKWINLYTLQQQMWHSDLKTTSIYLYLNSRESWEEIQKLQF